MYRFTPPAPWFTVDELDDVPLFLPSHRAAGLFALRVGGGRLTFDNRRVLPYSFSAWVDSHSLGLRLVPAAKGAAIRFDAATGATKRDLPDVSFRAAKCAREGRTVRLEDSFRGVTAYLYGEFSDDGSGRELRFAVSWISQEQAEANFRAELAGRSLDEPWEYVAKLPDSTGRIGQFVAGNEPGFHIPYLYNYAGRPDRTQKRIRQILDAWFRDDAMGLPGDEDGGGMSAFVVFSMLGFYPVTPGFAEYQLGSPVFEKAALRLGNGRAFTILAPGSSREAKYWTRAEVGGRPVAGTVLRHSDVVAGGTLVFTMADRPAECEHRLRSQGLGIIRANVTRIGGEK